MKDKQSIILGAIAWKADRENFLEVTQIEDALAIIKLSNFGKGVQKIIFVPMGVPKNDPIHKESIRFYKRSRKLEIYKRVPIEDLSTLTVADFLRETAQLFYTIFTKDIKKKKIKDFDLTSFNKTIEQIFTKKGWLVMEQIA